MVRIALPRDILRPAPCEQLDQDCELPRPRVMKDPTCATWKWKEACICCVPVRLQESCSVLVCPRLMQTRALERFGVQ